MNPLIYFGIIEKSLKRIKDTMIPTYVYDIYCYVNVQELHLTSRIPAHLLQWLDSSIFLFSLFLFQE